MPADGGAIELVRSDVGLQFEVGGEDEQRRVPHLAEVLLGCETGPRFWSRFTANIEELDRVVGRDNRLWRALEAAEKDAGNA